MIRKLELKDYDSAKKLVYQVHKIHYENRNDIYTDGNPFPKEYFNNIINDNKYLNYVYEENNQILGLLIASKKTNNNVPIAKLRTTYFIDDIVVDNNYRRKGIGKILYNYLLEKAKNNKIDSIELNVWSFNKDAIKFYEELGMSVKNMKLEHLLNNNLDIEYRENSFKITNKVNLK